MNPEEMFDKYLKSRADADLTDNRITKAWIEGEARAHLKTDIANAIRAVSSERDQYKGLVEQLAACNYDDSDVFDLIYKAKELLNIQT